MVQQNIQADCVNNAVFYYDTYAGLDFKSQEECFGDYIILTEQQYVNNLDLFVQHKRRMGYHVVVYDVDTEGLNTATKIREFLLNLYNEGKYDPLYLLLVGSLEQLPVSSGINGNANNPPTDIYYACLESSTIANEPNLYPEILVGRWLVNDSSELYNIMKKTIRSEEDFRYTTLCHAGLFSGTSTGTSLFNRTVKWISSKILSNLNYPNAYYLGNSSGMNSNSIKTFIKADTTWLFYYIGQATYEKIESPYQFAAYDLDSCSFAYLGFGFAPWLGDVYRDCFAKDWLCRANIGGPLYYASTTESNRYCNKNHSKRIFRMLKKGYNMHIAEMTVGGSNKYYGSLRTSAKRRAQIKKYLLFGDPSLYIWGQEMSIPYRAPQRPLMQAEMADISYVYGVNGFLYGIGDYSEIIQDLPNGLYIIYNSNNNTYRKIFK